MPDSPATDSTSTNCPRLAGLIVVVLCAGFAPGLSASTDSASIDLIEGRTVTVQQSASQSVSYVFDAAPQVPYLLQLVQQGLDFVLSLEHGDSEQTVVDSPLYRDDREFLVFESADGAPIRITVSSREFTGAEGTHSILIHRLDSEPRQAERRAWEWMSRGGIQHARQTSAGWIKAVTAYERAASLWQGIGRLREYAQAIYSIAWIEYWQHEKFARGMSCATEAEAAYRATGEIALAANAKQLEAASIIELQQGYRDAYGPCLEEMTPKILNRKQTLAEHETQWSDEAFDLFAEARQVHQELGNLYDVGKITNNIGLTHFYLGAFDEARKDYEKAAAIFRNIDEREAELDPLNNLEVINFDLGYLVQSIETMQRIIELMPDDRMTTARADYLDNLANGYLLYGNLDDARRTYAIALELHEKAGDVKGRVRSYMGLGRTYYGLGIPDLAADNLEEAIRMIEEHEFDDDQLRETATRYLGNVEYLRGDFDTALRTHSAAQEFAFLPTRKARLSVLIAGDLIALGRASESLAAANEARRVALEIKSKLTLGDALMEIGRAKLMLADLPAASVAFTDAREIYDELGLRDEQARSISHLAAIAREEKDYQRAVELGGVAIELLETLRSRVADPEIRASYTSIRRSIYEEQIYAQMALHRGSGSANGMRDALTMAERSTGRMMVDLLGESRLSEARHNSTAFAEPWLQLNDELANQRFLRDRLIGELSTDDTAEARLRRLRREMLDTENRLKLIGLEARLANPEVRSVTTTQPLLATEVKEMVDQDSVLIRFFLGSERSFAWVVTESDINAIELPPRGEVETIARRAYAYLRTYQSGSKGKAALAENLEQLSDTVLRPLWEYVDKPRILVSADAVLQYIPFGLLPRPDDGRRLIDSHEIVSVPSMTAVKRQRELGQDGTADRSLAIFADPVFEKSDERLMKARNPYVPAPNDPDQFFSFISTRSGGDLRRLAGSGAEADAIAGLVPADSLYLAKGFAANRDNVLTMNFDRYRYIHFATHGQIDARYPSLSSLALSRFDAAGKEQNGFLRLYDILNLDLNADLVVLSACDTALGKEIRGEGLIGLAHGFMYAGTRSMIVSLWQVPDQATAALMTRLYEHMFTNGLSPSQALREAQRSVATERRWRDPYFWGAFTVLGDWQ